MLVKFMVALFYTNTGPDKMGKCRNKNHLRLLDVAL